MKILTDPITTTNAFRILCNDLKVDSIETTIERYPWVDATIEFNVVGNIDRQALRDRILSVCGGYLLFLTQDVRNYPKGPLSFNMRLELNEQQIEKLLYFYFHPGTINVRRSDYDIDAIFVRPEDKTTTVKWADGSTTTVKCRDDDKWDTEAAVNACFIKKLFSSHTAYQRMIKEKTVLQMSKNKEEK